MTGPTEADLARARRQATRERSARLQAEQIAEEAIADLYAANRQLDERVRAQTLRLEDALARASLADQAKSAFLEGIAHHTGTPLHAIQGFIELVAQDLGPGALRDAATTAAEETRRLGRAFDSLLQMSAAVSGALQVRPAPTVLSGWIGALLARHLPAVIAAGRTIDVRLGCGPSERVLVDDQRLDQVVDALVHNAREHGAGVITITVDRTPQALVVTVEDEGDGIPADLADRALEPFVGAGTRGFGIGLTLAQMVAEALGGGLTLDPDRPQRVVATVSVSHPPNPQGAPTVATDSTGTSTDDTEADLLLQVDVDALKTLREEVGVPGFVTRLVEVYLGSVPGWTTALEGAQDAAVRAAHSVSSSSRQLGLHALGELAKRVELEGPDAAGDGSTRLAEALGRVAGPLREAAAVVDDDAG